MNILIVDDDVLIRNWLTLLLRQVDGVKIQRIAEATDGIHALELLEEQSFDLVITDIRMPRMNGIELIKELKTKFPKIRTAVLSAFDDFEYVKVALKNGALDYILKAEMQMEDIAALLSKTVKDIQLEHLSFEEDEPFLNALSDWDTFFSSYLNDPTISETTFFLHANPCFHKNHLQIVLIRMAKQDITDSLWHRILIICADALKTENKMGTAFLWNRDYLTLLYNASDSISEHQEEEFQKLITAIDKNIERYAGIPIRNSINISCAGKQTMRNDFFKAIDIMDYRQYYHCPPSTSEIPNIAIGRKAQAAEIQKALSAKDCEKALHILKKNMDEGHQAKISPRKMKNLIISGINVFLTSNLMKETPGDMTDQFGKFPTLIFQVKDQSQMEQQVSTFCALFKTHCHSTENKLSAAIRLAIQYIDKNYSKKITLDDLAAHVYLNRSYLSYLFKKEMNIAFGNYLESVRIEKAKILILDTNKPISIIAEEVGFSNQNYFTKVFKRATGTSPLKYRRR